MEKKVMLASFEEVANKNGYEVFSADEVAEYYKEGLMKSRNNELSKEEKEIFTAEMITLQKAVCMDDDKEVVRFYRPKQVEWEVTENGTLMKGLEGTYLDTDLNRRLNRVGQAFSPSVDFLKSIICGEIELDDELMKSIKDKYEDKKEVREREAKLKEREGGIKGDEKLHEDAEKKDKSKVEKSDKEAEIKGGEKGDRKLHEEAVKRHKAKEDEIKGGEKGDRKLHEEAEERHDKIHKGFESLLMKGSNKHYFSTEERKKLAKEGEAMPDGSFPIRNEQDLKDAIRSVGRASNPEAARRWIKKRAKEMGKESILPEDWK